MKKIILAFASIAILLCSCGEKETNVPVTSVTINNTSITIVEGSTAQLSAVVAPSNATNKDITWSSDNGSVATVDANGLVTAVKEGSAHIVAAAADGSGKKASCNVTVTAKAVPVTGISLKADTDELWPGEKATITATVTPDNATDKSLKWSSDNTAVATVADGVVTAVKGGSATITATANDGSGVSAFIGIIVKTPVESITLDPAAKTVLEGESFTIAATVAPDNATDKTIKWSSSDESVATVKDGVVTTLKAGSVVITATAADPGAVKAECAVTVNGKVNSITLNATEKKLWLAETFQLEAAVEPATATDKTVTWASSNTAVATVDDKGLVTAVADGEAEITVTANDGGGAKATCKVIVKTKVETITLDVVEKALEIGETLKVAATVAPEAASDKTVTWTSSNPAVATVDANGLVTAVKPGATTITVTANDGGGAKATCRIVIEKKEGTEDYNQNEFEW